MLGTLFPIVGRRVALYYGILCCISVAIIVALYLSSVYGLERYVAEQVEKQPWDVIANQGPPVQTYPELQTRLGKVEGVEQSRVLGMLRGQNGVGLELAVDGRRLPVRWIVILGATDQGVLPPELRLAPDQQAAPSQGPTPIRANLVGTATSAVALAPGSVLELSSTSLAAGGHLHNENGQELSPHERGEAQDATQYDTLFKGLITQSPTQVERQDFNKFVMRSVGSLSYLPERSLVVTVPMPVFRELAEKLDGLLFSSEGLHGVQRAPPYVPEISHLMRIDRETLISSWDLRQSLRQLSPLLSATYIQLTGFTPSGTITSHLFTLLARMADISDMVVLLALLMAIPLIWLAWIVAQSVGRLVLMNERRTIGLLLIRGVAMPAIERVLAIALMIGGMGGGLLGLAGGIGLTIGGYTLAGRPLPPSSILTQAISIFLIFLLLGMALTLLSGWRFICTVRRMTPGEAIARVAVNSELDHSEDRISKPAAVLTISLLLLGSYKIASWLVGHSLILALVVPAGSTSLTAGVRVAEALLSFVAVPMFLGGLVMVLRWKSRWFQWLIGALSWPIVGHLRWYVSEHLTLSRSRITSTIALTALAVATALLPQVAADTFYNRISRGVATSVGGDVQLDFSLTSLAGGHDELAEVRDYRAWLKPGMEKVRRHLLADSRVEAATPIVQFLLPTIYLSSQSGLPLNLIEQPDAYGRLAYHEEGLGLTRPFSKVLAELGSAPLVSSRGFRELRMVPGRSEVMIGYYDQFAPVPALFEDVIAFLPGQPKVDVEQREGFAAAEVDYMNFLTQMDARAVTSAERFDREPLSRVNVSPSRVVFLLKTNGELSNRDIETLVAGLPVKPQNVRSRASEQHQVNKDMFISLALENMKVFKLGGLVLAISGLVVVGLANYQAEKRSLSLLRLRGTPTSTILGISLSIFWVPVLVGIVLGTLLGITAGYGTSQAIWEMPRVYGVAGFLENRLIITKSTTAVVLLFAIILSLASLAFGLWPVRKSAHEAIMEG
jgi:hypothetical protein